MAGRTVSVNLGGRERQLRFDLNAIAVIGERLGLSGRLNNLAMDLLDKPLPLSALRTIVWAGLIWDTPDLTEEEVGSWIDLDNIGEVWERFFTLFSGKSSGSATVQLKEAMKNVAAKMEVAVKTQETEESSASTT